MRGWPREGDKNTARLGGVPTDVASPARGGDCPPPNHAAHARHRGGRAPRGGPPPAHTTPTAAARPRQPRTWREAGNGGRTAAAAASARGRRPRRPRRAGAASSSGRRRWRPAAPPLGHRRAPAGHLASSGWRRARGYGAASAAAAAPWCQTREGRAIVRRRAQALTGPVSWGGNRPRVHAACVHCTKCCARCTDCCTLRTRKRTPWHAAVHGSVGLPKYLLQTNLTSVGAHCIAFDHSARSLAYPRNRRLQPEWNCISESVGVLRGSTATADSGATGKDRGPACVGVCCSLPRRALRCAWPVPSHGTRCTKTCTLFVS